MGSDLLEPVPGSIDKTKEAQKKRQEQELLQSRCKALAAVAGPSFYECVSSSTLPYWVALTPSYFNIDNTRPVVAPFRNVGLTIANVKRGLRLHTPLAIRSAVPVSVKSFSRLSDRQLASLGLDTRFTGKETMMALYCYLMKNLSPSLVSPLAGNGFKKYKRALVAGAFKHDKALGPSPLKEVQVLSDTSEEAFEYSEAAMKRTPQIVPTCYRKFPFGNVRSTAAEFTSKKALDKAARLQNPHLKLAMYHECKSLIDMESVPLEQTEQKDDILAKKQLKLTAILNKMITIRATKKAVFEAAERAIDSTVRADACSVLDKVLGQSKGKTAAKTAPSHPLHTRAASPVQSRETCSYASEQLLYQEAADECEDLKEHFEDSGEASPSHQLCQQGESRRATSHASTSSPCLEDDRSAVGSALQIESHITPQKQSDKHGCDPSTDAESGFKEHRKSIMRRTLHGPKLSSPIMSKVPTTVDTETDYVAKEGGRKRGLAVADTKPEKRLRFAASTKSDEQFSTTKEFKKQHSRKGRTIIGPTFSSTEWTQMSRYFADPDGYKQDTQKGRTIGGPKFSTEDQAKMKDYFAHPDMKEKGSKKGLTIPGPKFSPADTERMFEYLAQHDGKKQGKKRAGNFTDLGESPMKVAKKSHDSARVCSKGSQGVFTRSIAHSATSSLSKLESPQSKAEPTKPKLRIIRSILSGRLVVCHTDMAGNQLTEEEISEEQEKLDRYGDQRGGISMGLNQLHKVSRDGQVEY